MRVKYNLIVYFFFISCSLKAQDKWSQHIEKLDSIQKSSSEYANLIVEIAWQISDLSPDSAIYYGELGLSLAEEYQRDTIRYRSLLGLSGAWSRKGEHSKSIELSLEALQLSENSGDTTAIFDALNNIGIDYYYLNDFEKSLEYFRKSADVIEEFRPNQQKSRHQFANALMNMALVEAELGNTSKEIETYRRVRELFSSMGDTRSVALVHFNLGKSYYGLSNMDSAEYYYDKALKGFKIHRWTSAESDLMTNWAELKFDKGEYFESMNFLKESLILAQNSSNELQVQFCYNLMARIFEKQGVLDSALIYQRKYFESLNQTREKEKEEHAEELMAKYESDKKEQQIANLEQEKIIATLESERQRQFMVFTVLLSLLLLAAIVLVYLRYRSKKKTSELLDVKNQELAKLNNTKDRLFSIISHDLKSPLSSFHAITRSLSDNWENLGKDQLKDFIITLRDSSADVKNMMDNLLKWALAQTGELKYSPQSVAPSEVIERVKNQLEPVAKIKKICIANEVKSTNSVSADQQFLEIVIRNLLSNAVKFSNIESEIKVRVTSEGSNEVISIQDSGVGMDQTEIDQLLEGSIVAQDIQNSTEKGTGLGLTLCKELIAKMGAEMSVSSEKEKGTTFKLVFSKAA
ncbi:tetratricopeptide repeat-containing sensor histidine kinase [Reichenbachiella sp.]|uniref:tetratricopeptide repeat-containing sensor histidine kinase n=1 Tax=Reichenbachiella sp. TaxID=2184521 RepID=UPI003B5AAA5F